MAIRWKNKALLAAWVLLFTLGLSGSMLGLTQGSNYAGRDYFQTPQFESQLNQFVDYLSVFELNYLTKEEAKQGIIVTAEEIKEHRYRYGDLAQQVENIKGQYEYKISDALAKQNKEAANLYAAERDKKIADIINNFKSDEYVRVKVVKEKEQRIDEYFQELENYRADYERYRAVFKYNLTNTVTGAVYSNLNTNGTKTGLPNDKDMVFTLVYPGEKQGYLSTAGKPGFIVPHDLDVTTTAGTFQGQIGIPKSVHASNPVLADHYDYQQRQKIFYVYTACGLIALLLSLYLYRTKPVSEAASSIKDWQQYYGRIPIDFRLLLLAAVGFLALIIDIPLYHHEYLYTFFEQLISNLLVAAVFVGLTLVQGKLLLETVKDRPNLNAEWRKSLSYRFYRGLKEAFLIRSTGTQILILLAVVFAFGAGATIVLVENSLIMFYIPLFMVIGLPVFIMVVKRAGYFNSIVNNVNELAQGEIEPDLPVRGNSVLAKLAQNINTLKHGVKISRREQAKSERLKTELITNVSHDLRTPLTSIITYTELLKTPDLSADDREAYIQIIDRKSKRLKVLIDDLFEASKMASGSIDLVKEKVDLVQLLQQALAEHNETISESTLQFRVVTPEKPVYAIVDGQKIWRVFDNLIGNILKYALDNTRVYISVNADQGRAIIVFKNVTKYELGENIDELFERFKRGDRSRNTEGSGLGLAIAKSIIDLHEGSMDIELDGDLFKITIFLETTGY